MRASRGRIVSRAVFEDEDAPSPDLDPPVEIEAAGLGIDLVLLDEDAGRQRLLGVVLKHWDDGLEDDRAHVDLGGDEVDRAAGEPDAPVDGPLLDVEAGEGGQERRVDVDDAVLQSVAQRGRQDPHVAGEADEIDASALDLADDGPVVALARSEELGIEEERLEAPLPGPEETRGVGLVAQDEGDFRADIAPGLLRAREWGLETLFLD